MNEYFWVAVSFTIFWLLAIKPLYKILFNFLKRLQDNISLKVKEAMSVYNQAMEKLEEAKAMQDELNNTINYIMKNNQEAIDYELADLENEFYETLQIKQEQFHNQVERERFKLEEEILEILRVKLEEKFLLYFKSNKNKINEFTNLMLKK